ncbi:FadR/GntR family transcriptional regulator [Amnibacterium endophyticum]|uniref:FadR/GntR family transcriptional regulator n=1 Tax=Amnibacterium endophyticum TaxID=2109337 RepID=A0ABW4LG85_9MICO
MARKSLVNTVADDLLDRIVAGEFSSSDPIPGEQELTARHDVSRVTVREAVKTLEAQGVVRVEQGRGTFVNPVHEWTSMEAVLRAATEGTDGETASIQLIELRRIFETGASMLAASKITSTDLQEMHACIDRMRAAHARGDVDEFVAADLEFHDTILNAAGNVFLTVLFRPLTRILAARRRETSKVAEIQRNAIVEHEKVWTALESRDPAAARRAMESHMNQTLTDLRRYVLSPRP